MLDQAPGAGRTSLPPPPPPPSHTSPSAPAIRAAGGERFRRDQMHIKSRRKRGGWRAVRASWVAFRLAGGHRDGEGRRAAWQSPPSTFPGATQRSVLVVVSSFFMMLDCMYAGKIGAFCEELPSRKALVMLNWHFRAGQLLH